MMRRTLSWLLGLIVVLAAFPARAADGPLDVIPRTASVVLRLKAPDQTLKKVTDFANKVDPNAGRQVQGYSPFLGMLISNPTMAGVDRTKDWYAVVFARSEEQPALVFVIPAKDAGAMQQALGQQFKSFTQGDYVVYSEDGSTIDQLKSRGAGQEESITKAVSRASQEVIDGSELSLFVNVPRLREVYKAQLEQAREQIDQALEQMEASAPPQQGVDMSRAFKMYGNMAHGLLQAVSDINGLVVALQVRPEGVAFVDYLDVASGTPTAKFLSDHKPAALAVMNKLPAGKLFYAAAHGNISAMSKWGMEVSLGMYQLEEEEKKTLEEILAEIEKLEFGSFATAFELGDLDQGLMRSYTLVEARPVERMRELTRKSSKLYGELEMPGIRQTAEVKPDAEKYGSHTADVVIVKQEFEQQEGGVDLSGMFQGLMDTIWGPGGMTQRYVYLENKNLVAQTLGGGRAAMEQLLKSAEGGDETGALQGAAAQTRKALAEEANIVALLDLPRLISRGAQLMAQSGQVPIPVDPQTLDELKLQPSYAGLSVTTGENSVRIDTYVPRAQIQGTVRIVRLFMEQMQEAQQRQF